MEPQKTPNNQNKKKQTKTKKTKNKNKNQTTTTKNTHTHTNKQQQKKNKKKTKKTNNQNNPKEEKHNWRHHDSMFQAILQNCSHQGSVVLVQKQTHRQMEQKRKPRNGLRDILSTNLQKSRKEYAMEK